jgi:hypothetical protein
MRDPYALRERLREEETYRCKEHGHGSARVLAPWARPLEPGIEMGGLQFPCDTRVNTINLLLLVFLLIYDYSKVFTGVGTCDIFASYTDDPLLLTFARQFCDTLGPRTTTGLRSQGWGGGAHGGPLGGVPTSMERWCARVLYECVAYDKPVALLLYLQLHHATLTAHWINYPTQAWSLRISLELSIFQFLFQDKQSR